MKQIKIYEIRRMLEDDGHFDVLEDMDEIQHMNLKMQQIKEILKEERIASNAKVSAIKIIVNGENDEILRFFC